ncbi:Ig-like domain-containing protein [Leptospira sp. WS92.C1]
MTNRILNRKFFSLLSVIAVLFFISCDDKKQSSDTESTLPIVTSFSNILPVNGEIPSSDPEAPSSPPVSSIPTVILTSPANAGSTIPINSNVSVFFSTVMDKNSVTTNTLDTSCSGTISVSSDDFATCVRMNSAPVSPSAENDLSFRLDPAANLAVNTQYKIRISGTIKDVAGTELPGSVTTVFTTSASADITPPTIQHTLPVPFDALVGTNASLSATFTEPMDPTSLTVNTSNTTCTGSIQVSDTNFATCKVISLQPVFSNNSKTFVIRPASPLSNFSAVSMKITTNAKDTSGNQLAANHILSFTTQTNDSTSPQLVHVYPAQNQTDVARNRTITLNFTEKINPSTFVLNSLNTNCIGTVQISADNFNTCVRLRGDIEYGSSHGLRHTLFLMDLLEPQTTYRIKLTNGIKDLAGNAFGGFTQANGFTTGNDADNASPTITTITPDDGSTNQSTILSVEVIFSEEMNSNMFTTSVFGGTCAGNIQVSADNFNTCVPINGMSIFTGNKRIRISANTTPLQGNTTYKVRIKGVMKDAANNNLGADFTQTTGFTTGAPE